MGAKFAFPDCLLVAGCFFIVLVTLHVFWTQVQGPARCTVDPAMINPLKLLVGLTYLLTYCSCKRTAALLPPFSSQFPSFFFLHLLAG